MIVAGVRYRFANGLRSAMRVWGAVIVAFAIAEGLRAAPPLLAWARGWMATPMPRRLLLDGGVALFFGIVARSTFASSVGAWGAEQLLVLPLSRRQRYAIDYVSGVMFLLPPLVAMVLLCGSLEPVVVVMVSSAFCWRESREKSRPSSAASRHLLPAGEGLWLMRGGEDRMLTGIAGSTLMAAASWLAIHNNGVTSPFAILRIEATFLSLSAGVLASAILNARDLVRPYRLAEATLPISAAMRLRALLTVSFALMLVPLLVVSLLRFSFGALAYGAIVFAVMLLFGEASSLRRKRGGSVAMAVALVAAVGGALDGRIAAAIALLLLPVAWWQAITADATSDLRVIRSEVAA